MACRLSVHTQTDMKESDLITGAGGLLGHYLIKEFNDQKVKTLGLKEKNDYVVDLARTTPSFGTEIFDTVIHAAGTEDDTKAMELNLEGTRNLLNALEINPPQNFVYISSYKVYSRDAGENVDEDTNTWASDDTGKSKALAEDLVKDWCGKREITLTIIRPARMFGKGVKGETLRLFNDAISGKYIHIRDNNAKISLVCALDVARALKTVYKKGGLYNASDNIPRKFIEMVESMTANVGAKKRMTHLPAAWAEWVWRIGRIFPSIQRNLSPQVVEQRMKSLTLDSSRIHKASGIKFHDSIAVIERRDKDYPYEE